MKRFLLTTVLAALLAPGPLGAAKHRGLWFWRNSSSPYGSDNIVGNTVQETLTVLFIKKHGVRRLYGSYGNRPISEPNTIAAWNERLQDAGIQSQLLLSENTWIFPANRSQLLDRIQTRLLDFNDLPGRTIPEKFDALHLDIEPQGLSNWSSLTPLEKRDHLNHLRDTFADVRQYLTNAGLPTFPVYADLPVWFDNFPGSIGWSSSAERDAWFDAVALHLTGITLMPFDRDTFSSIDNGVTWERSNITAAQVRCGLEADIGTSTTWPSVPAFNDMMNTLESAYGTAGAVDIQSYRLWREAIAAQPIVAVEAALKHWHVGFDTLPGWNYVILESSNLCTWKQIYEHRAVQHESVLFSVDHARTRTRAFWRVERFQPFDSDEGQQPR